jgi:hypothetical protein
VAEPTSPHGGDELVDLALGHVQGRRRAELTAHLLECAACRADYEALSTAVGDTVAAVPSVQPPVGFDAAVLERLAAESPSPGRTGRVTPRRRRRRPHRRARPTWWIAAAAAIVLIAGAILYVAGRDDGESLAAVVPLRVVESGETVGTVSVSEADGQAVLVVAVLGAPPDVSYTCRMWLEDGTVVEAPPWPATERGAWIVDVPGPVDTLDRVELVATGSDHVWSSASF